MARDITELIEKEKPAEQMTPEEFAKAEYEAELARMRDFTPDAERILWPDPIAPRWK